jgi:hypothetical protein
VDEVRVVFRMSYFQERLSEETYVLCYKHVQNVSLLTIFSYNIWLYFKKPTIIETVRLNRLRWFGHVQRMEENRIPKRVLCMNLGTTRLRGKPRNRWQDEVRDGRIVGGEGKSA